MNIFKKLVALWIWLVFVVFASSASFAYDSQYRASRAYDDTTKAISGYDEAAVFVANERECHSVGARTHFINFSKFLAAEAENLSAALRSIPGVDDVAAFGSRTTGAYSSSSDLDIAIFGKVDVSDPLVQQSIRQAQAAVGPQLDINVFANEDEMFKMFLRLEHFDPVGKPLPVPVSIK